nr:prefoldin subunit 3 [Ciona intestinalis]|eukprot:XP_002122059.1 prefoldin subunit 3 [Ciona intestinalis]
MEGDSKVVESKPHLGIPEAVFVEDVAKYLKEQGSCTCEEALKKLEENYQKYKLMEVNLLQKKQRLKQQIPDLKSSLDIVKHMKSIEGTDTTMTTNFFLSGALHAKAKIPPTKEVCLWLGANVMLSYSIEEALGVLNKNYTTAISHLDSVNKDLEYLRDQFTTTEVMLARLYNWNVKQRRAAKATTNGSDSK